MLLARYAVVACVGALTGCGVPAPASQVPTGRAAVDRVHATQDCGIGVHASAKIDHFGKEGRIRTDLLAFAIWPDRIRMDVVSPFGVTLATLTSDGKRFALYDLKERRFVFGPPKACNIARLTTIPMPGHVLVSLLRGEAPVLKHAPSDETITWNRAGYYVVTIKGTNNAEQRLALAPHPDDMSLGWEKQRFRLLDVVVKQADVVLFHVELGDYKPAPMDKPLVDPDGLDQPIPTSGPTCTAELPRRIHMEVPGKDEDVIFRYEKVTWNPPLPEGVFTQPIPSGVEVGKVDCEDGPSAPPPAPDSGAHVR
jgi:hypothetical protein